MIARDKPVDGALKVLELALRIAIAWTLLSLLSLALWALLPEVGRRLGSRGASRPPALEERQPSAELRAIYANLGDDVGARGEDLVRFERDDTAGSDDTRLIVGTASARKR